MCWFCFFVWWCRFWGWIYSCGSLWYFVIRLGYSFWGRFLFFYMGSFWLCVFLFFWSWGLVCSCCFCRVWVCGYSLFCVFLFFLDGLIFYSFCFCIYSECLDLVCSFVILICFWDFWGLGVDSFWDIVWYWLFREGCILNRRYGCMWFVVGYLVFCGIIYSVIFC